MFFKLLKYDLKSIYKSILIIDIVMILACGLTLGTANTRFKNDIILGILGMTTSFIIIGAIVVYFYTILKRYSKSIYGNEGYLLNTLPVKPWEIVLSKIVSAIIMGILTLLCGILCIFIFFMSVNIHISDIIYLFNYYGYNIFLSLLLFGFMCVLATIVEIIKIYAVISISHISIFDRFRVIFGIVLYFIIMQLESLFIEFSFGNMLYNFEDLKTMSQVNELLTSFNMYNITLIIYCIVMGIIWYFIAVTVINKKLYVK